MRFLFFLALIVFCLGCDPIGKLTPVQDDPRKPLLDNTRWKWHSDDLVWLSDSSFSYFSRSAEDSCTEMLSFEADGTYLQTDICELKDTSALSCFWRWPQGGSILIGSCNAIIPSADERAFFRLSGDTLQFLYNPVVRPDSANGKPLYLVKSFLKQ